MADQRIEYINLKNLVLWTENPRDPIDPNANDQDVVERAIADKNNKWNLLKLAKEMGSYYDFSEIPTVVYHGQKPVVYDGNRRIILGKLKLGLVQVDDELISSIPEFPSEIPCNVCDKAIALTNVYRKHAETGSWMPIERDIFLYKFMKKPKSTFLIIDECTGIITNNPHMNKRFIKEEIFNEGNMNKLGFKIDKGTLFSNHTASEAIEIIDDIIQKLKDKRISTREARGKLLSVVDERTIQIINKNMDNKPSRVIYESNSDDEAHPLLKQTRRVNKQKQEIFGGKLYLLAGDVSNLYRDISDLYSYFQKHKMQLSGSFASLIRMSLRLLCETAASDKKVDLDTYVISNFDEAKRMLSMNKDVLTSLASYNINKGSIMQQLHIGAHNYSASRNIEQTIAMSAIVGAMISITHGSKDR